MIDIEQLLWGMTPEGEALICYTMRNAAGAEVRLTNFGATVLGISTPDREGKVEDVVLGYKSVEDYRQDSAWMGRCVGRCAGRIAMGRMTIDGEMITLDRNEGRNHINGGVAGFGDRLWESRVETNRVVMSLRSEDGDQHYPGNLNVEVAFDFDDDNSFEITYLAQSSSKTVVNLTHSIYLNLKGESAGNVLDHELRLNSLQAPEINLMQIPTGQMLPTKGTPQDFTEFRTLGAGIEADYNNIANLNGYDHPFAISGYKSGILSEVGELRCPQSGRTLQILSSNPCVVVNTANFLTGSCPSSKSDCKYQDHDGVAISCQHFPDAVNHSEFPSPILEAGAMYCQKTVYKFGTY